MRQVHEFEIKNMLRMALEAKERAYAPYSDFKVGACLKGASGAYYMGANIENASYSPTVCAERVALFKAVYDGEKAFDAIAIVSDSKMPTVPCGVCRQVLAEFCDGEMPIICACSNGEYMMMPLSEIYPAPFKMGEENHGE
ncbi:MAG: cytidine deaminase [Clostridia bacterium]|nr:cytidine deaminase [Clostridia bacterium]